MFKLFQILFIGCVHKWEIIKEVRLESNNGNGTRYYLQCKECGNIKHEDVI